MSEHEKTPGGNHEYNREELEKVNSEQHERIREDVERRAEQSHESLDDARHEALEQAKSVERRAEREESPREARNEKQARRERPASKQEREASFKATMKEVQSQMSGPSRTFSKVIHNKAVERTSDAVGGTIARPNAILFGSLFAFLFTAAIYLVARYNGYPLSGSETIAAFVLGWVVGLIVDFLRVMITGKKA